MAVEEHRRIALHRAAADTWGEEVADTLVDMVARDDVEAVRHEVELLRHQLTASEERLQTGMEALRHELLGAFERGIADAVTHQTRTLVLSQLGALVVIAGLAFGLASGLP